MRTVVSWAWFRPSEEAWDDGRPLVPLRRRRRRRAEPGATSTSRARRQGPAAAARPTTTWLVCADGPDRGRVGRRSRAPSRTTGARSSTIKLGDAEDPYPGDRLVRGDDPRLLLEVGRRLARLPRRLRLRLHLVPRGRVERRQPPVGLLGEDEPMTRTTHRARRRRCSRLLLPHRAAPVRRRRSPTRGPPRPRRPSSAADSPRHAAPPAAPYPTTGACYASATTRPSRRSPRRYAGAAATATTPPITYAVGDLDTVVDGHLLAVDSDRGAGPGRRRLPAGVRRVRRRHVGGTAGSRMLRPVWFTPTVEQSDAGADWYRCDVVAIAADETAAPLVGRLQGRARPAAGAPTRYAMCGTAEPGTAGFRRVDLLRPTTPGGAAAPLRDIAGATYPGVEKVRAAGQQTCQDAAAAVADDPLNYRWGYEWPTPEQWQRRPALRHLLGTIRSSARRARSSLRTIDGSSWAASPGTPRSPSRRRPRYASRSAVSRPHATRRACQRVGAGVSEPQLAQLPGVALPVLGDLHVQVEVDRGAEQGLDLLAGHGCRRRGAGRPCGR